MRWGIALFFCVLSFLSFNQIAFAKSRLIKGTPVTAGTFQEVVLLKDSAGKDKCTATVVGPKVILTAAHCAQNGDTVNFKIGTQTYTATMYRSPLYLEKEHDVALGISAQAFQNVSPVHVVTALDTAKKGMTITLLGYGCSTEGGGPIDGILRKGDNVVVSFSNYNMNSYNPPSGAALCLGDSGGPTYINEGGKLKVLGVHHRGNMKDTNMDLRLDMSDTQSFLSNIASTQSVEICGVNSQCGGSPPPPPPPGAPSCSLSATPSSITLGQSITFKMQTLGEVTSATIDGHTVSFPAGQLISTPSVTGFQKAKGIVTGPGGTGQCEVSYTVEGSTPPPGPAPTCTLTANPSTITLGKSLKLNLQTQGEVTEATINGTPVSAPSSSIEITPVALGTYSAWGTVIGPKGSGSCKTNYIVGNTPPPPPPPPQTPNLTVVPTHCGYNTLGETNIWRVCLAVLSHDSSLYDMTMTDAVFITYRDTSREVMPVLHTKKSSSGLREIQELTLYANGTVSEGEKVLLDHRIAQLTVQNLSGEMTPLSMQGRASNGQYFMVEEFKPFTSMRK